MSAAQLLNTKAGMIGAGLLVAGGLVYFFGGRIKKTAEDTVDFVGGVFSGNNSLTKDTPYEDKGILGTLGSAANEISGGWLQHFGETIGGSIFDVFHKPYDPNNPNTPVVRKAATLAAAPNVLDSANWRIKW